MDLIDPGNSRELEKSLESIVAVVWRVGGKLGASKLEVDVDQTG
jgi:hypothetical protein